VEVGGVGVLYLSPFFLSVTFNISATLIFFTSLQHQFKVDSKHAKGQPSYFNYEYIDTVDLEGFMMTLTVRYFLSYDFFSWGIGKIW
jgi:hypothetical protein